MEPISRSLPDPKLGAGIAAASLWGKSGPQQLETPNSTLQLMQEFVFVLLQLNLEFSSSSPSLQLLLIIDSSRL